MKKKSKKGKENDQKPENDVKKEGKGTKKGKDSEGRPEKVKSFKKSAENGVQKKVISKKFLKKDITVSLGSKKKVKLVKKKVIKN